MYSIIGFFTLLGEKVMFFFLQRVCVIFKTSDGVVVVVVVMCINGGCVSGFEVVL